MRDTPAFVRFTPYPPNRALQAILDPRRMLRWVYLTRLSVAAAIFLAAVFAWEIAATQDTLVASLGFAVTMTMTVASVAYTELYRRPARTSFLYLQCVFDLVLVTAAVHVTGGGTSPLAALYILVIAIASLFLPVRGGLLVAALGIVLYVGDALLLHQGERDLTLWLQLGVFTGVALGSAWIGAHLREAGSGTAALAAELRKMRLQAADLLRHIRSGVVTVDAQGNLLFANPAAAALLHLPLEERLGTPILDELSERAPELAGALAQTVRDGSRTTRGEGEVRLPSRRFPIGLNTTWMDGAGDPDDATATAIFQDISDQKRLESLRLRTERLEAVAELSASLAHEIKNPLASIRSAVEQLASSPRASEDEETLATLILRESDRLSRLLSEFLDFAVARAARMEKVDLAALLRATATMAATHPDRGEGVRLAVEAPAEPLLIDGDDDLLHRALFNLVLNAVQATPPDGVVTVSAFEADDALVPAGVAFDGGALAVRVADTGPGIPPELRARIFDPFFTTKAGGTGLGLAVVHRAVEAHRGVVLLESGAEGTRFTVLLPRTQSQTGGHA